MATSNDLNNPENEKTRSLIKGFKKMIRRKMKKDGWDAYLLSFMFHPVPGATTTKLQIMAEAIYCFYATFLTRVVRNPNSIYQLSQRPLLFAAPDYPVPKCQKQRLVDVVINDGLHIHGLLAVPWDSRLRQDVVDHVRQRRSLYLKSPLRRIDIRPIENRLGFVVDYVFKSVKKRKCSWDDLIVLPKSHGELTESRSQLSREMAKWIIGTGWSG